MISNDPRRNKYCRVHVYFGTVCKAEIVDVKEKFEVNLDNILKSFGLDKEHQKDY